MNITTTAIVTLASLLLASASMHADDTNTIIVLNKEKEPVTAEVCTLTGSTRERIGHTQADGKLVAPIACKQGQRLLIRPDDSSIYFEHKRTECPLQKETRIEVTRKQTLAEWVKTAQQAEAKQEYGKAAKAYDEIAKMADTFDEDIAKTYQKKNVENLGKQFQVDRPFKVDPLQNRDIQVPLYNDVMSDRLKDKVKNFQRSNGLNANGELDKATMDKIGTMGKSVSRP